jgi:DNA-binding GntR family transcriptional regulator
MPQTEARRTVADQIAEALARRIVIGDLPPGAPLRQDHVAHEFGSSHVPVREAFQRLHAQGLAVNEPRRGMRVAPLDERSMREVVEIRASLEVLALRHAARWLTPTQIERIEDAVAAGDRAQSFAEWESANRAFHHELVAACRMPRLLAMLEELQLANSRFTFAATRSAVWQPRSNQDHRQILDALRRGTVDQATALLGRHIQTMERVGGAGSGGAAAQTARKG